MSDYSVYKHILPKEISGKDNDMIYIGITYQEPQKRWQNGKGYKNNQYFTNAIGKYGWANFMHEILYTDLTKEEAEQKEIELIAYHKSDIREFGYNIDHGGNSYGKHSDETKQKMSENHADFSGVNHPMYGKSMLEETKRKIGDKNKVRYSIPENTPMYGKHLSDEHRAILSDKAKERTGDRNPFYNKHHTEETKKRISEKAKERLKDPTKNPSYGNTKKVICLDNGIIYPSVQYVSEKFGLSMGALYMNCKGKSDKCGGYRFRYLDLVEGAVS